MAEAAPDGYTLLFTSPAHDISRRLYEHLPCEPAKHFTPLVRMSNPTPVPLIAKTAPATRLPHTTWPTTSRPT